MTISKHQIEPELARSPPRRVSRRGKFNFATLCVGLLLVAVVGMFAILTVDGLHSLAVRFEGNTTFCTIIDHTRDTDSEGKQLYYLHYRANINGIERVERERVDEATFASLAPGTVVPLKVSPWFPGRNSFALFPGRSLWEDAVWTAVSFVTMLPMAAFTIWFCWILPKRAYQLVTHGTPVVGRLTGKTIESGQEVHANVLHYQYSPQFEPSLAGATPNETLYGKQSVSDAQWNQFEVGDQFTVLYDPANPRVSTIYVFGDYAARG